MFGFSTASYLLSVCLVALFAEYPFVEARHVKREFSIKRSPVILVPGDGGSQLEAKLDKPTTVHSFCDKKTEDYFNLWLNPNLLFPGILDCWVDNMRLLYNHTSRSTMNSPGVDIRVPGFGDTDSVEWISPSNLLPPFVRRFILSNYFVDIADTLVKEGYTRGKDIRGAPYDYRKAPNELKGYFSSLSNLVEETYSNNNFTKVTFVCHSMGCPIVSYFFNQQPMMWKMKYIKGLISIAGAYGGAVKAMKVIASGENLGILIVSQTKLRIEQRTSPSLPYMLPSRHVWSKNEVLAMTKHRNYTVEHYADFFRDMNFSVAYEMFKDTQLHAEVGLNPPGVEVHCLHGQGLPTPERLDYTKEKSFPDSPNLIEGDGDGTVNLKSMRVCLDWRGKQSEKIFHLPFPGVEHMKILSIDAVKEYIKVYATSW